MVHFVAKEESFAHTLEALAEVEIFGRQVLLLDNQPYTFGTLGKGPLAEGFDKGRAHTQASVLGQYRHRIEVVLASLGFVVDMWRASRPRAYHSEGAFAQLVQACAIVTNNSTHCPTLRLGNNGETPTILCVVCLGYIGQDIEVVLATIVVQSLLDTDGYGYRLCDN